VTLLALSRAVWKSTDGRSFRKSAEENIWTEESPSYRKMEKISEELTKFSSSLKLIANVRVVL
jgi:hypothetical protein